MTTKREKAVIKFCADHKMTQPETTIIQHLRNKGFDPNHPFSKTIMAQVALVMLAGIAKAMKDIEDRVANPVPAEALCFDEIATQEIWVESMKLQIGRLKGMRQQEGLRLGRLWGKVVVRDDDPDDPKSEVYGFVGYKLGDTIYPETDEKICGEQIDNYHAGKLFKRGNGR